MVAQRIPCDESRSRPFLRVFGGAAPRHPQGSKCPFDPLLGESAGSFSIHGLYRLKTSSLRLGRLHSQKRRLKWRTFSMRKGGDLREKVLSIAPMMDWTDRHFRYFFRQISKQAVLYTEMITAEAILRGDRSFLLDFSEEEHPVVLQLGGSDPERLAEAAQIGRSWGYDAINLNVGCPSPRVQEGRFGACLMAEADLVANCVGKIRLAVDCPVTVKHRIGIDQMDSYEFMEQFVRTVAASGCKEFTVHARAAWLQGLSPKENREIPPLRYHDVYRLKAEHPELFIEINGGIATMEEIRAHLQSVDGVMIGRAAYHHPLFLRDADATLFPEKDGHRDRSEADIFHSILDYLERWVAAHPHARLHTVTRHLMGFWHERPGARDWRSRLSQISQQTTRQGIESIKDFLKRYVF